MRHGSRVEEVGADGTSSAGCSNRVFVSRADPRRAVPPRHTLLGAADPTGRLSGCCDAGARRRQGRPLAGQVRHVEAPISPFTEARRSTEQSRSRREAAISYSERSRCRTVATPSNSRRRGDKVTLGVTEHSITRRRVAKDGSPCRPDGVRRTSFDDVRNDCWRTLRRSDLLRVGRCGRARTLGRRLGRVGGDAYRRRAGGHADGRSSGARARGQPPIPTRAPGIAPCRPRPLLLPVGAVDALGLVRAGSCEGCYHVWNPFPQCVQRSDGLMQVESCLVHVSRVLRIRR